MLTKSELLEFACGPNRLPWERLSFYKRYELMCWVEAVRDRGLRCESFNDNPLFRSELVAAVKAAEIIPPRRSDTVPFIA